MISPLRETCGNGEYKNRKRLEKKAGFGAETMVSDGVVFRFYWLLKRCGIIEKSWLSRICVKY